MSSLLRSTKFVRYFTGAARTLIINSSKTTDVNLLINSKALSAANNVLLRDYATKKKESLEPLLQKLDSEVRRYGRITKRDIDEVFDELRAKNDITSSQSLLVIRCCGELVPEELPEQRTLLVQKIWNVLIERGVPMDVSHYNALLRVYIENEHPFSPAQFLEEMEKKGLQPNRVTYQRLMWRYCQEGDVEGATRVLEKMRELNMPVSEPVLNALVMGHAFHGDTEGAKAVLETMAGAGLKPSNRTYALLACGYAKQGDITGVENVITKAQNEDNELTDKDLLDIVEQLALGGHKDKIDQIFPHLHKGIGYNQEVCNLIFKLLNKDQEEVAKEMMRTMPKTTSVDDTKFKGAFFVKHLLKLNKPMETIIQSCRNLQSEGLVPSAIYIATEAALQQGRSELAQKLFKELQKDGMEIRQHFYWPLLTQKGKERDEEGLLQIVRNMTNEGLVPTGEALRDYVIPFLIEKDTPQNIIVKLQVANVPVILSARNVMIELLESGDIKSAVEIALTYHPRGQYSLISRPLLSALNKTKDIKSFVNILHVTSSSTQTPQEDVSNDDVSGDDNVDCNEIGRLVKNAVKIVAKDNLTEELLTTVLGKGLRISTTSAEEIEQYLGKNMTTKISELLSLLTSPDLEMAPVEFLARRNQAPRTAAQLETLLGQVINKDGNNINRLRKQVINAYMKEKNIEKVNSLAEELKSLPDFDLNLSTLAQLFEFYCENDEIDRAEHVKTEIIVKDPEFVLNKYKKVLMACAYVRANRFEEAIKFLQDNKTSGETEPSSFLINSKSWQMLNTLAESKDVAKVKEMTKVLIENEYIAPNNIILGPSIKVHLLNNDIEGALNEFENCCKQYRSTPWKGELMKALIMKEDATKLQWLADLSTQIHGEVNILHDLVLAFVECGRLRQARRILETPGLQTRQKRLNDACQRYVEDGKSEYLEGLLEATKELSHIDRSNIFYHLLVTYCKANETDKALGLWTVLQEEGEIPSEEFLSYLGNHLKSNNRDIPFVMPSTGVQAEPKKKDTVSQKITTQNSQKEPAKITKSEISNQIETLTKEGNTAQAMDLTLNHIKEGVMPKSNVLKFLLKSLAEEGNVEKIKPLGTHLSDTMKRTVTYDDKLTLATFNSGNGASHMDNVLNMLETANTKEEVESALRKFPRSSALASAVQDSEIVAKCHKIVELAASKGYIIPVNLLWIEYLLAGKDKEADSLWQKYLNKSPVIVFRRLLQECHMKKQPQVIEKMIEILRTNKDLSLTSLGNAYSRLINFYISENKIDSAKATLTRAIENGITNEHLNQSTIRKLKENLESAGQKFDFSI
ncbi:leucine-rich PPR motif-containing protein, mitochondrial [Vanessa atalanta]|uniref:leucine-rich PPR motif-containing protein, mitochondrial n=1 Tax=Vanessa atalanta TaxID=42275 RepID=UPI001FCE03F7|nr:leucine-rich PPR motif-containing protein, mitochondrial [Vanessa atalanta]